MEFSVEFYDKYFGELSARMIDIDHSLLNDASKKICATKECGGKVIIVGNGGSSAISSHVAVDLTKNAKIRAVNFNEADLITCFANDYGYEEWVSRAISFYADKGDVVVLISSSGMSKNIINGALKSKEMGLDLITLSGFSGENELKKLGDLNLYVNSVEYNIVENCHQIWMLAIVDEIISSQG
jgi:D-sedoheptulose 7-phosphate isomerase